MKIKPTIAAAIVLVSFNLAAQESSRAPALAGPNAAIIAKLTEIVQIREQLVQIEQVLYQSGRESAEDGSGVQLAEIALAEARADLAREQGRREALIAALQDLVAVHEQRAAMAKRKAQEESSNAGRIKAERAQAALLEAQVRLLRAQK